MLPTIPILGAYVRHADLPLGANLHDREWWEPESDIGGTGLADLQEAARRLKDPRLTAGDVLWLVRWR